MRDINGLKGKKNKIVCVKAAMENRIVFLDESDDEQRALQLSHEFNCNEFKKKPLKIMVRKADSTGHKIREVFGDRVCRQLTVADSVIL